MGSLLLLCSDVKEQSLFIYLQRKLLHHLYDTYQWRAQTFWRAGAKIQRVLAQEGN